MAKAMIDIPLDKIAAFCHRWKIKELALFGSVLRDDFRPDSDIDILVTFHFGGRITFNNRPEMLDELSDIFGREIDLIDKQAIRNPFRRHAILKSKEVIYAA
jgi:uncharacterized protein